MINRQHWQFVSQNVLRYLHRRFKKEYGIGDYLGLLSEEPKAVAVILRDMATRFDNSNPDHYMLED